MCVGDFLISKVVFATKQLKSWITYSFHFKRKKPNGKYLKGERRCLGALHIEGPVYIAVQLHSQRTNTNMNIACNIFIAWHAYSHLLNREKVSINNYAFNL